MRAPASAPSASRRSTPPQLPCRSSGRRDASGAARVCSCRRRCASTRAASSPGSRLVQLELAQRPRPRGRGTRSSRPRSRTGALRGSGTAAPKPTGCSGVLRTNEGRPSSTSKHRPAAARPSALAWNCWPSPLVKGYRDSGASSSTVSPTCERERRRRSSCKPHRRGDERGADHRAQLEHQRGQEREPQRGHRLRAVPLSDLR